MAWHAVGRGEKVRCPVCESVLFILTPTAVAQIRLHDSRGHLERVVLPRFEIKCDCKTLLDVEVERVPT